MGGTLVVGARDGGGAAFTLSLPLAGGADGRPIATRGRRVRPPSRRCVRSASIAGPAGARGYPHAPRQVERW